jgi:O-antigen/teichoic acid export membrane protein
MVAVSLTIYLANRGGLLPINSVYAEPLLPLVIMALSFASAINGFQSTGMATATRNLNQKRLVQIILFSQVLGLMVMIPVALTSRSIWALVAGNLSSELASMLLSHLWIGGHRNRWRVDRCALRELLGFGKWVFLSSILGVLASNGDRLLLGALVSPTELGLYAIAVLMTGAIETVLGRLFTSISLPALSEVARNNPAHLCEVYYKMRLPSDLVLLFVSGGLFSAGQFIIDLLYDQRYAAAGGILQILSLSLLTTRFLMAYQIYLALGLPRYIAMLNLVRIFSIYSVVPALYFFAGRDAAIWGIALHGLATLPLIFYFNARHGLIRIRRELVVLVALPAGMLCGNVIMLLRG